MIIKNTLGLSVGFLDNGSVKSVEVDPIRISLKTATPFSKLRANIYLRRRTNPFEYTALTGPESNGQFRIVDNRFEAKGSWSGIDYLCKLILSNKSRSWQWSIDLVNKSNQEIELDLIYIQDVGMKPINSGAINEYYVSQYIERLILEDSKYGSVICCRQNMRESVGNPWLMMACSNGAMAASVDGMQFYGTTFRETGIPEGLMTERLGGEYAGESSLMAIQEKPFKMEIGKSHRTSFIGTYLPDHPLATSTDDLKQLPDLFHEFDDLISSDSQQSWIKPVRNLFNTSRFLPVDDLNDEELSMFFGTERRHLEKKDGKLLSFFGKDNNHVVLRAKEVLVDRPHGHIMQAKAGFEPDESIVSTNAYAYGVFNSHLTQGNTNFNTLLSVCSNQFNLSLESGQRVFVKIDSEYYILGVPSAFEIGLNHCRWIYQRGNCCFQVRTWTSKLSPQVNFDFKVIRGNTIDIFVTHDFDELNGWTINSGISGNEFVAKPKADSMIASKFLNPQFRIKVQTENADYKVYGYEEFFNNSNQQGNLFVFDVKETSDFCMSFIGEVCSSVKEIKIENADEQWLVDCNHAQSLWQKLSLNLLLNGNQKDIASIREIMPWYGMNALTHFLTPYGLEQFSGAAWGTRDVSQGPIDLLLTMEKYDEAKQVLCIIFSNQNTDGGWPQWWMFDRYTNIRAHDSHGDVVYWTIIALSNYIKVTGDLKILDEILPYYNEKS